MLKPRSKVVSEAAENLCGLIFKRPTANSDIERPITISIALWIKANIGASRATWLILFERTSKPGTIMPIPIFTIDAIQMI